VVDETPSIWTLLGVPRGASKEEIRKQFKIYVKTQHPDVVGKQDADASTKFSQIMSAYREIMDMDDDRFWFESNQVGDSFDEKTGYGTGKETQNRYNSQAVRDFDGFFSSSKKQKIKPGITQDQLTKLLGLFVGIVSMILLLGNGLSKSAKDWKPSAARNDGVYNAMCTKYDFDDFCATLSKG
jgi:hypothetical protein